MVSVSSLPPMASTFTLHPSPLLYYSTHRASTLLVFHLRTLHKHTPTPLALLLPTRPFHFAPTRPPHLALHRPYTPTTPRPPPPLHAHHTSPSTAPTRPPHLALHRPYTPTTPRPPPPLHAHHASPSTAPTRPPRGSAQSGRSAISRKHLRGNCLL
ncbi:vegetative cell wall protein gp1-like [Penaeus japonicus]|uniref:vegetative cell wall protein gp1-like n=1 Tax=Penaeus japonicus TaxID=27405 RepID=UPI001C7152AD|nr:vegetative cell wall protein gp1-like [Penaeus japonicus]